jgi:transposase
LTGEELMAWRSGQSYSADLRHRVLAAVDGGSTAGAVALRFEVSLSYIYKALARRRETGETQARAQRSHQGPKLADQHAAIRAEVASRPGVTLDELRAWLAAEHDVSASLGLMHNTLARLGLTRKKRPAVRRSRAGRTSPGNALPGATNRRGCAGGG